MRPLNVMIVGGGIGGMTLSLCLAQQGHQVSIFERAVMDSDAGAGVQLSPNGARVLHSLGLASALEGCAFLPQGGQFRHFRSGRLIAQTALGAQVAERYGAPYYHIHRGDLHHLLLQAVKLSPNIVRHVGVSVDNFEQHGRGVEIKFSQGVQRGDLLVGADGIHSTIRDLLWGAQPPHFTGQVAWRTLVPAARLPKNRIRPMASVWWGPGKHFVHYYVRRGELVNCVCVVEKSNWQVESWSSKGDYAELKKDFAGWHDDVQHLIDQADHQSLYKWALYDRAPMSKWGKGRVTLLGDACHPTLPFMAQGAAMAIEDAAVLTACVKSAAGVAEALQRYEKLRRPRTAYVQRGSRRHARVFHLSGVGAWMRNLVAAKAGERTASRLFAYDARAATKF